MKTVYLYTGGPRKAHPIHQECSRYAPDGFQFTPSAEVFFSPSASGLPARTAWPTALTKRVNPWVLSALQRLHTPNVRYISVPRGVSLIHSAQYPLLNHTPWVIDFEQTAAFTWFDRNVLESRFVKSFFEHLFTRPECRALLAWSSAAKSSLLNAFDCQRFADKIRVAHLTIIPQEHVDRSSRKGTIELLFCSGKFYYKGGLDVILTALELMKQYDVHLTVVSQTPEDVFKKFGTHPRITFHRSVSASERHALMRKADIFLHPGHSETYGFVILEAFSFGLPVISTDGFSAPELIEEGVRGYVVKNYLSWFDEQWLPWVRTPAEREEFHARLLHPPQAYIERLASAASKMIEAPQERLAMSERAYQSITEGMFSPAARLRTMKEIYTSALHGA